MSDLYSVLGVNRNSSQDEIKNAYRKLASIHHPDRGGDTKKFQEIQAAYDVLGDPQRRAQYDTPQNPFGGNPFGGGFNFQAQHFDLNDIFNQIFGGRPGGATVYRTVVSVTLDQVYHGGEQTLHIQTGTQNHMIKIEIPRGISDGAQIRYDRLIPGAHLIVEYRVSKHLKFERRNQDLIINQTISVLDLIAGTQIEIETISGTTIVVSVDPLTSPTANLKVHGHGLPIPGTNQYGDLFVSLRPIMPSHIHNDIIDAIVRTRT